MSSPSPTRNASRTSGPRSRYGAAHPGNASSSSFVVVRVTVPAVDEAPTPGRVANERFATNEPAASSHDHADRRLLDRRFSRASTPRPAIDEDAGLRGSFDGVPDERRGRPVADPQPGATRFLDTFCSTCAEAPASEYRDRGTPVPHHAIRAHLALRALVHVDALAGVVAHRILTTVARVPVPTTVIAGRTFAQTSFPSITASAPSRTRSRCSDCRGPCSRMPGAARPMTTIPG